MQDALPFSEEVWHLRLRDCCLHEFLRCLAPHHPAVEESLFVFKPHLITTTPQLRAQQPSAVAGERLNCSHLRTVSSNSQYWKVPTQQSIGPFAAFLTHPNLAFRYYPHGQESSTDSSWNVGVVVHTSQQGISNYQPASETERKASGRGSTGAV